MLVTLHKDANVKDVQRRLVGLGQWCEKLQGSRGEILLALGPHSAEISAEALGAIPGIAGIISAESAHPLVDDQRGKAVRFGDLTLGPGHPPVLMAGPCSVEGEEQIHAAAQMVAEAGARVLRGGAFKPRTSPYSFRGYGRDALTWLREAANAHGLAVVTEVMSEEAVELVAGCADLLQVGSRNMQNFALLRAVGKQHRPVLLKRGMAARVEDWLLAGEHLLAAGASDVIFCERGIIGFDPTTRNLLDLAAVALLSRCHKLAVVVDPSHALGRQDLIPVMGQAALCAGAHGLLIEAHPYAATAMSDGAQALDHEGLGALGWNRDRPN